MQTTEPFHKHRRTREEFAGLFGRFAQTELYDQRGETFENPYDGIRYFIGMAVCEK